MPGFLGVERLSLGPWPAFERALQRLFVHAGFDDVRLVGGSGDGGADVVAEHRGRIWVAQAKYRGSNQLVGPAAVDEVIQATQRYGAAIGLLVTNSGFTPDTVLRASKRAADVGLPIYLWNRDVVTRRYDGLPLYAEHRTEPRNYQREAVEALNHSILSGDRRGLLLMATGLGKTRVAAAVMEQWLLDHPGDQVLLIAPSLALVPQLDASLWSFLPKTIPTHVLTGREKPVFEGGLTIATPQSAASAKWLTPERFGLVLVDEAHHAPANAFRRLLDDLNPRYLLGMTATPWRGDQRALADLFGKPVYTISMVEGMQRGYLASVDYRMLVDSVDWDEVHRSLKHVATVRDLNRVLFVPERDEAVVASIVPPLVELSAPHCVLFSRSIDHAERIAQLLRADGHSVRILHSRLDRFEATRALHEFRSGIVPAIVTVDMLNEGIDIPEVNLIVFLRVTHSRRIFVQQLGRGLRLAQGKTSVRVLDFVSDVRRVAAALELNRQASEVVDRHDGPIVYETGEIVKFSDWAVAGFVQEYLSDVAELDGASEDARLRFPEAGTAG